MILTGKYVQAASFSLSKRAILANSFMTEDDTDENQGSEGSMKDDWSSDGSDAKAFFTPDDFDIYVNKITGETYIFHGPDLPHNVERLEYDPEKYRVNVVTKDGLNLDLGVKIQWLVRPYFSKAKQVFIVKTKNGESIDGIEVPMTVKGKDGDN
ncbi:MAG: hypothetical protein DHS20C02_00650 [Micavibrio sp.]|nr:MAG: hypothetical protein DHS20C02_00650 [Micavibrio sp.]